MERKNKFLATPFLTMINMLMLIVISDLHFTDGTASLNVSHRAFSHFFNYLQRSMRQEYKELIIVFAGDTFDLLRSNHWMAMDEKEKPWNINNMEQRTGSEGGENRWYQKHITEIFHKTIEANSKSLEILKQIDGLFSVPIAKIMVLGNHDRMLREVDHYLHTLSDSMGSVIICDGMYNNQEYGVTIRHGHEFDSYNYENGGVPIGDVNTVELFVRIPFLIKEQCPDLEDELKSMEDIRPQWRIFDYLRTTYTEGRIQSAIKKSLESATDYFLSIPYVQYWIGQHDSYHPFDSADKLQYVLYLSKILPVHWAEKLLKIFSYFEIQEPHYENMAEKESSLYVVYGHTHKENIAFLGLHDSLHRYYINSGTWRERILASSRGSFTRYKTMTYALFYKKEERVTAFPAFELWNGALRG